MFEKPRSCGLPEWTSKRKFCSKKCCDEERKGRHHSPATEFKKGEPNKNPVPKGTRSSPKTEFKKGHSTWNKGRKSTFTVWNKGKEFKQVQGDKHWNWKGGKTKVNHLTRNCIEYKNWRKECYERDDYTCVKCGGRCAKGNKIILECDHIKPFYKIMDENNIKTIEEAKNCTELWDINNGRTLCLDCHKETKSYNVNQHTNG